MTVKGDRRVFGKVVSVSPDEFELEWFTSPGKRDVSLVQRVLCTRYILERNSRVYFVDRRGEWRTGRVYEPSESGYHLSLPNEGRCFQEEADLYIRCLSNAPDPTETLQNLANESPFWFESRLTLLNFLLLQRAAFRGMTALTSANILLFPHQFEVVHRVLSDPIQRYLLADEVGLGKTIEAGVIARQLLLDSPRALVLILAPKALLPQWRSELFEKLAMRRWGAQIKFQPSEAVEQIDPDSPFALVIIDEAHHAVTGETSYNSLRRLSLASPRLLLLSATPALHDEDAFLRMLHLLDPDHYALEDVEGFRDKVRSRQDVGAAMRLLSDPSKKLALRGALSILEEAGDDRELNMRLSAVGAALESSEPTRLAKEVSSLRAYVREAYRLHRRMLRTSRTSLASGVLPSRSSEVREEYAEDERLDDLSDLLEEWRQNVLSGLEDRTALAQFYAALASSSTVSFELAGQHIGARLERTIDDSERDVLRAMQRVLARDSTRHSNVEVIAAAIEAALTNRGSRLVCFSSSTETAQLIYREVRRHNIETYRHFHSRPNLNAADLQGFTESRNPCTLICDSSAEEGLNLESADLLFLADLPWSPNQIEQRIGRVDRIGKVKPQSFTVFIGSGEEGSLDEAWFTVLNDGLGIFRQSIADLQFLLTTLLPELLETALQGGAGALMEAVPSVAHKVEEERRRLSEQASLDELELAPAGSKALERIQDLEARSGALQDAFEEVTFRRLHFGRSPERESIIRADGSVDPEKAKRLSAGHTRGTLLPLRIAESFEIVESGEGTFERHLAAEEPALQLFRLGNRFVDGLNRLLEWDDRGKAYAIWRLVPTLPTEDEPYFRVVYSVQADLGPARKYADEVGLDSSVIDALTRRADGWFPPFSVEDVYDFEFNRLTDPIRRQMVLRPYDKARLDTNISADRAGLLDRVVPGGRWRELCKSVREISEKQLRASDDLCKMIALRVRRAKAEVRLTESVADSYARPFLDSQIERELPRMLLSGIEQPSIALDSIGVVILSGASLEEVNGVR